MDEFQEVADLLPKDQFERVMRSAIQGHKNVSCIFLGSRHHMLRRMFSDRNRPFYRSAIVMIPDKPPFEESVDFVVRVLPATGIPCPVMSPNVLWRKSTIFPIISNSSDLKCSGLLKMKDAKKPRKTTSIRLAGFYRDSIETNTNSKC